SKLCGRCGLSRSEAQTVFLPLLLVAAALTLVAAGSALAESQAARMIRYLESPDRERWQEPERVIRALDLKGGESVTDLGAGSGYFTWRLAETVGARGLVDAADVSPEMLDSLEQRLEREKIGNVRIRRVRPDDPELAAGSVDLVFLCDTYNQMVDRAAYVRKLAPGLKPDGRVAIVDFHKREDISEGPALDRKIARETVIEELRRGGFELAKEHTFLPYQYFLVFRRAGDYSFQPLVRAISQVMSSAKAEKQKQREVASLLADYLKEGVLEERFQRPNPSLPVTTYLLHAEPTGLFSIASLVFKPRARTTVHDHQSWVVWGTYSGEERETRFRRRDLAGASFPELEPAWSRVFSQAEISFIDPPPGDIHDVENVNDGVSVSVHVHATDISKQPRHSYDLEAKTVRSFVQAYEPAL
ncbi:MAG: methyltransferase domain-containing protein, partial [Candidatus Binatia bacterium]